MRIVRTERDTTKKWEISIMELRDSSARKFKVTRRIPKMAVAETKAFRSKIRVRKQLE